MISVCVKLESGLNGKAICWRDIVGVELLSGGSMIWGAEGLLECMSEVITGFNLSFFNVKFSSFTQNSPFVDDGCLGSVL